MVAYFRLQNNLLMALGAGLGLFFAVAGFRDFIGAQGIFIQLFFYLLFVIGGVVLGRLWSSILANRRLKSLNNLLYVQCDPKAFLEKILPIAEKIPAQAAEHVDARGKIAYAYEALGEMDKGLEAMAGANLSALKLHVLQCTALVANQTLRLHLMKGDVEAAKERQQELVELQETAERRAPMLGKQLTECIRLGENWLKVLQGEACDLDYLRDEVRLSRNRIYQAEMLLVLAQALKNEGQDLDAKEAYIEAAELVPDLYAGKCAKKELGLLES